MLLQQAATAAAFHYKNVEIVETQQNYNVRLSWIWGDQFSSEGMRVLQNWKLTMLISFDLLQLQKYPSPNAMVLAESISGLGQQYNRMDASSTDCSVSFSLLLIDLHSLFFASLLKNEKNITNIFGFCNK